jgi:hypothetical protein
MTDLNTLVRPDSSLYLLLANDINARGEIVGYASDTNTNAIVAFLAIPVSGLTMDATQTEGNPGGNSKRTFVPDNIRRPLPGFGRFVESK